MPRRLQPLKVLAAVAAKGAAMAKGTTKGKGGGGGSGKSGTKAAAATATAAAGAAAAAEAEAVAESAKRQSSGSEDEVEIDVVFFLAPVSGGSAPTSKVKGLHQVSVTLPVNQSLEGDPEEKQLEKELDSDSDEDAWHVPLVGKLAVAVQLAKRRVGPASVGKFALINETDLPVLRATRLCLL